ncbi:cytidine deaminase [Flavobacterium sp.]|uniref:cytidine deaminase n=1 Tax=Flavobacterium sp. TaxID=239 RepID=UPI003B9D2DAE
MKKQSVHLEFTTYENLSELPADVASLMQEAIIARDQAYAPYSRFRVGAAILLENGAVVTGSNQENAAYPSGLCAERVAVFYAGAKYPGVAVKTVAVTACNENKDNLHPIPPCGACRQSLAEYEMLANNNIELFFMGAEGAIFKSDSIKDLLPFTFDKNFL